MSLSSRLRTTTRFAIGLSVGALALALGIPALRAQAPQAVIAIFLWS